MELIKLQLSPAQLRKVRKGLPIRVTPAMVGSGVNLIVDPTTYNRITRRVKRNKGINLTLSPEVIEANMAAGEEIEGEGLFGKRFDRALKKAGIKKAAYKVGDILKPAAKYATKKALSAGVAAAVTPIAGPTAGAVAGKVADAIVSKHVDKFYDDPDYLYDRFKGGALQEYDGIHQGVPYKKIPRIDRNLDHLNRRVTGTGADRQILKAEDDLPPALQSRPDLINSRFKYTTNYAPYKGRGLYA